MRKSQLGVLEERFRTAPNHGTSRPRHGFVHIRARMIETHDEGAFGQQSRRFNLLKLSP